MNKNIKYQIKLLKKFFKNTRNFKITQYNLNGLAKLLISL